MKRHILIIDDNKGYVEALKEGLKKEFILKRAFNGRTGLAEIERSRPDIVILDIGLPDIDGFEVCRILRESNKTFDIPIIMLTIQCDRSLTVRGLVNGADKYITKSASVDEIKAHIKSLLRRIEYDAAEKEILTVDGLRMDLNKMEAAVEGKKIRLTKTEFNLLAHILRYRGSVIGPAEFYKAVWNYKQMPSNTKTLEVHIYRIRKKLGGNAGRIINIHGKGYTFK